MKNNKSARKAAAERDRLQSLFESLSRWRCGDVKW